ncbi:MAG: hypothetical protein E7345_05595 [Clostridiales bacterium]|nr:hypothetical protein [Clostridiales bacterium]
MATVGNNTSAKFEHLREAFFTKGEKEQFEKIMRHPKNRAIHERMLEQKAETLYKKAMVLIEAVERGEFDEKEMAVVEYTISHYLAGIDDLHPELILEKTPDLSL